MPLFTSDTSRQHSRVEYSWPLNPRPAIISLCSSFIGDEMTVDEIVKEHLRASRRLRKSIKGSPEKARKFLIEAGVLNKKGTKLARMYR